MLEKYVMEVANIRIEMCNENWNYALKLCNEHLKELDANNYLAEEDYLIRNDVLENYWFVTMNLAKNCKEIGLLSTAYKLAKQSLDYIEDISYNYRYYHSCWSIGSFSSELGLKEESIENFKICTHHYKQLGDQRFRLVTLFNIAKELENSKGMLNLIKIYENNNLRIVLPTQGDMSKDENLYSMYTDLFKLYTAKNQTLSMFRTLNILKDKELKKELRLYLKVS